MQKQHLELKEIIWEVIQKCNNGCTYCGSKDGWKKEINEDHVKRVADEIRKYNPLNIDITLSGGDPLLLSLDTHKYIVERLGGQNNKVKIIINPKSFNTTKETRTALNNKLFLYDWVGVSVNTLEELALFKSFYTDYFSSLHDTRKPINITIITNFNLENIFIFDKIKEVANDRDLIWQIQYTIYKDKDNPLAIYNNDAAYEHLNELITSAFKDTKILLADNLNNGKCGAGSCSIGILANGDVVPCLSMRSWNDDKDIVQGNIIETQLEYIWKNMFKNYRFCEFGCCKDWCGNKAFAEVAYAKKDKKELPTIEDLKDFPYEPINVDPLPYEIPPTYVYGVGTKPRPNVVLYGVGGPNITQVYSVGMQLDWSKPNANGRTYIINYDTGSEDKQIT